MYGASKLLDEKGIIVTDDILKLGELIAITDADATFDAHTAKLKRIEIGIALRQAAAIERPDAEGKMRASTITETISNMDLCKMLGRAENTFFKYVRIAESASLLTLAANPNVSFSALDEIAACKKPTDPLQQREFMKRLKEQVEKACADLSGEEGQPPDSYRGSGPTRNDVVGMIRRAQIDFEVPTKGGNERTENKRQKELALLHKMSRLVGCFRIMFLNGIQRDEWLEKNGMTIGQFGVKMVELRDKLIEEGMIEDDPMTISVHRLFPRAVEKKIAEEAEATVAMEPDEVPV